MVLILWKSPQGLVSKIKTAVLGENAARQDRSGDRLTIFQGHNPASRFTPRLPGQPDFAPMKWVNIYDCWYDAHRALARG